MQWGMDPLLTRYESLRFLSVLFPQRQLKTAIAAKITAIPKKECVKVIYNFVRRVQVCLQWNGGHLEQIFGKP